MTSGAKIKLLTEILNLESVRVTKYQNLSGIGLILHLESLTREASCDRLEDLPQQFRKPRPWSERPRHPKGYTFRYKMTRLPLT